MKSEYVFHENFMMKQNRLLFWIMFTVAALFEGSFFLYCHLAHQDHIAQSYCMLRWSARFASGLFLFIYLLDIGNFFIRNKYMQKIFELRTSFIGVMGLLFTLHILTFVNFMMVDAAFVPYSKLIATGGFVGYLIILFMVLSSTPSFVDSIGFSTYKFTQLVCMHLIFLVVCVVFFELLSFGRDVLLFGIVLATIFALRILKVFRST